jgi:amidase
MPVSSVPPLDNDPANAFIRLDTIRGAETGPLAGLSLAVKDIYDVASLPTGCGQPLWLDTHDAPQATCPVVQTFLDAGVTILGKTHTDELAYSLMGMNIHYGTPINSAAPDRVPGGSSSGSAAAVAAGLVDIGLGSDTGGSVRAPASFCGLYGIRTTHGAIPLDGVMPLAPTLDTCGWFTRDADLLAQVGSVFGMRAADDAAPAKVLLPVDVWALADKPAVDALGPWLSQARHVLGMPQPCRIVGDEGVDTWFSAFLTGQAAEAWQSHGAWISEHKPTLGPGIKERFELASTISTDAWAAARAARDQLIAPLLDMLGDDTTMVLPAVPGPAPLKATPQSDLDGWRRRALDMLCPAGMAGLPQVVVPAAEVDGAPMGISLLGPRGSDGMLMSLAKRLPPRIA